MKKGLAAAVFSGALGMLAFAAPAQAQMYWRVDLGWSSANNVNFEDNQFVPGLGVICSDASCTSPGQVKQVGTSSVIGGGIGYRMSDSLRTDVSLLYRGGFALKGTDGSSFEFSSDITSLSMMLNLYYDFSGSGTVTPYLGLGAGFAQNKMDPIVQAGGAIVTPGATTTNFAWSFLAGVSVPISGSRTTFFDVGYRFTDLGKIEGGAGTGTAFGAQFQYAGAEGKLTAHEIVFGVRF